MKNAESDSISPSLEQELAVANNQIQVLDSAINILRKNLADFQKGNKPLTVEKILDLLAESQSEEIVQTIDLEGYHPYIQAIAMNWDNGQVQLEFYKDVQELRLLEPEK